MMHFLCIAWEEMQHGRKREALLTWQWVSPCDGQTRKDFLAWLSTTHALLCSNLPGSLERALRSVLCLK